MTTPVAPVERRGIWLEISLAEQTMTLKDGEAALARYEISSGAAGAGERNGSGQTPRGWHQVRAKIGADVAPGTVFRGRRPTGEIYAPALRQAQPERDWILTRILWLSGLEPGVNRLGKVDTMRRYIYIHGGPDEVEYGRPGSKGCIRMRNADLIQLFERVPAHTPVLIHE
ncbi:L,D-transpeptidase [Ectothiorhodospiraceae bacterium WFHF3C12]|nr:L,D-transpeptidase [Ectothiorhodospiraceae bacterium WFHF3C12]